jgi:hypothetical protein
MSQVSKALILLMKSEEFYIIADKDGFSKPEKGIRNLRKQYVMESICYHR